jgi:hypothetical protein
MSRESREVWEVGSDGSREAPPKFAPAVQYTRLPASVLADMRGWDEHVLFTRVHVISAGLESLTRPDDGLCFLLILGSPQLLCSLLLHAAIYLLQLAE